MRLLLVIFRCGLRWRSRDDAVGHAFRRVHFDFSLFVWHFAAGFGSDDQRLRAVRGVEAALEFEVLHATLLATVVFQRDFQSIGSAMKLAGDI